MKPPVVQEIERRVRPDGVELRRYRIDDGRIVLAEVVGDHYIRVLGEDDGEAEIAFAVDVD